MSAKAASTRDGIGGVLLLVLAAGYYWLSRSIPASSLSDEVGADGLPIMLAVLLAVVASLIVAKSLLVRSRAVPVVEASVATDMEEAEDHAPILRALGFVVIGIGYMAVAPIVGFAVGIALLVIAVGLYEREALSFKLVAVAAGGGFGFWLIFVLFLGTEQPMSTLLALLTKG